MRVFRIISTLFLLAVLTGQPARALEINYSPFFHGERETPDADLHRWQAIGPLVFAQTSPEKDAFGVRPFWVRFQEIERERNSLHILYPLFNHRSNPQGTTWDILNLLRFSSFSRDEAPASTTVNLFPFFFLRLDPNDPEREYFGLFPIAGNVRNLLGYDEIAWFIFPFSVRLERQNATTFGMPWPFIRFTRGDGAAGHHFWPLYGYDFRENRYERRYFLWPLGYRSTSELWKETPFRATGFLPFYAFTDSDRAKSRTYIWPFFGYTDSQTPQYFEKRYFWPLLVQRRGDSYINRWAPVYTHSIRSGVDKTWAMWPIYRHEKKIERDLLHEKTQILYFVYWNLRQSNPQNPEAAPAIKRHLWPIFSHWDNGAGRQQTQVLSPLEVFFPYNDVVRTLYSPLFAIYRRDRDQSEVKDSLLFNFITWTRDPENSTFHIGPLWTHERAPETRRWEILKGLVAYNSAPDTPRFRLLWLPREKKETPAETDPSSQF